MISIMTRPSTANHLTRPKKRGRGRKNIGGNYGTRKPSHDDNNSMTKHDRPPFFHFSRPNRFVNRPSESSTQRSGNVGEKVASLEERSMARPPPPPFRLLEKRLGSPYEVPGPLWRERAPLCRRVSFDRIGRERVSYGIRRDKAAPSSFEVQWTGSISPLCRSCRAGRGTRGGGEGGLIAQTEGPKSSNRVCVYICMCMCIEVCM